MLRTFIVSVLNFTFTRTLRRRSGRSIISSRFRRAILGARVSDNWGNIVIEKRSLLRYISNVVTYLWNNISLNVYLYPLDSFLKFSTWKMKIFDFKQIFHLTRSPSKVFTVDNDHSFVSRLRFQTDYFDRRLTRKNLILRNISDVNRI